MAIQTGKQPVTFITAAAILSLSLVVNLPGLAISPMLGTLSKVFPHTTETEQQLLTVLPNLLIIPFVLLSGRLSLSRHKILTVVLGLAIFFACGILYMFANSMTYLIIISCLLGCGAGLIIPFSTGFIADVFANKYRMKVMGLQSGISNLTVVAATFIVGWLCKDTFHWHLPFLVYLVAIIPLLMTFGLHGIPSADLLAKSHPTVYSEAPQIAHEAVADAEKVAQEAQEMAKRAAEGIGQTDILQEKTINPQASTHPATKLPKIIKGFFIGRIWSVIGVYFFISYSTMAIDYYVSYLVQSKGWSTELTGTITSLFFLFIFLPGFLLPYIVKGLKATTFWVCAILMALGLGAYAFFDHPFMLCLGAILAGGGYGVLQPLIYDKASRTVNNPAKATLALAFVLTANYLSIVAVPFIIDGAAAIFHARHAETFPFLFNFILAAGFAILAFICQRRFAFGVRKEYYEN
ncbi:MAG: MFS transporter [Muribaculaceae bacterium]|nr:MFS transporter [Muribaculaceae bacterium]